MQSLGMTAAQQAPWHRIKRIHFIGIGGSGMSGIAEVLLNLGYPISGSDQQASKNTERLQQLGATIFKGHAVPNIEGADVVVASTAIAADNPEYVAAKGSGIPIVKRAEMLAELMRFRYGIAIAGTHGKTTTTSLVTSILAQADLDPTFVIGGLLNSAGANARLGKGDYLIAEADESDASFLHLNPMLSVVTNVDNDHMETYGGDFERLKQTFLDFIQRLPFYGLAVVCVDDPIVSELMPQMARPLRTYGFAPNAQIRAVNFKQVGMQCYFDVERDGHEPLAMTLNLPGRHNVLNALAAISIAFELDIAAEHIQTALAEFAGIGRRAQIHGEIALKQGSVTLVDDYGHHPREVAATLAALKAAYPERRLVMVYQPHRYSRTEALFNDFVRVLADVEALVLLDIYAAGEAPRQGVDTANLCRHIQQINNRMPTHLVDQEQLGQQLHDILQPNDILLLQGAGNIGRLAQQLAQQGLEYVSE